MKEIEPDAQVERRSRSAPRCAKCSWQPLVIRQSIESGACSACRHEVAERQRYGSSAPSRTEYAQFRFGVLKRAFDGATSREIAELLADSSHAFPEIASSEIRALCLWPDSSAI